ncbi:transcription factor HES-2-like [Sitophilus oryzae]|uniref:Transcription factor HES-2-like n=1 Tax=Sitophilus oryzae TaxID=7048 RepID=A0A6J2XTT6_SITOR|nr:transcription factor HES-2-like [Sitophilus oryzae]
MKTEALKSSKFVSESRKIRKPLMEKKRRARINDSLESLKQILLESKTSIKEPKNGQRTAKLEKADILEMTVKYLQNLHNKLRQLERTKENILPPPQSRDQIKIRPADSSSDSVKVGVTLFPTTLGNGEILFVVPSNLTRTIKNINDKNMESLPVWRPW